MNHHAIAVASLLNLLLFSTRSAVCDPSQPNGPTEAKRSTQAARQELPYYFQAERLMQRELPQSAGRSNQSSRLGARRHIRVVAVVAPPFMMKREPVQGEQPSDWNNSDGAAARSGSDSKSGGEPTRNTEWYGYCMDFFQELLKYLPYEVSYEIYEAPDRKFGSKTREILLDPKNNKSQPKRHERWSGMIGELSRGRAHLALAPISVMAERELVVDFTVPFYDLVGIQILLKRPEVPRDWFKFLTVLDNEVWLSITLAYFVTSLIIYLFDRLSPYSHKNMKRVERIRARRRQRMTKIAAAHAEAARGEVPLHARSMRAPGGQFQHGNDPSSLPVRPLSKQHEMFVAAPSGVVYPLTPGSGIRAISGLAEVPTQQQLQQHHSQESLPHSILGGLPEPASYPTQSLGVKPRRLSQDYLQSLRSQRHHQQQPSVRPAAWSGPSEKDQEEEADLDEDELDSDSDQDSGVPDFNLRDSLWFCITSLTPQGGGEAPQNLSGRVVAGAWWLFCFIVIASYTANLAAFLTVSRLDIPIESLDDLAKQYRIKYAPIEGTAEQSFFERMAYIEEIFYNIWKEMSLNDSLSEEERSKFAVWDYPISDKYTKIWAQIQEVQMPTSLSQAIERVKSSTLDDGFALLANANIIRYATMTDCSFRAVGEEFSRKPIALALQKNQESLRDDLSYAILQLINRRYMEVLREKWWTNNPDRVVCDLNDESEGISIENIGGVFIIILAGVLLSFLVWAAERLLYRTKLEVSQGLLEMGRAAPDLNRSPIQINNVSERGQTNGEEQLHNEGNSIQETMTGELVRIRRKPGRASRPFIMFTLLNLILLALDVELDHNLVVAFGDEGEAGIELTRFQVPTRAKPGELRRLTCQFKLHGATLHAMKLFKDDQEFYRFTPAHQKMTFPVAGVQVDLNRSRDGTEVWLKIKKNSGGQYKCQVLIEGTFKSVSLAKRMEVDQADSAQATATTSGGAWQHHPTQQQFDQNMRPHLSRQPHSAVQQHPSHLYGLGSVVGSSSGGPPSSRHAISLAFLAWPLLLAATAAIAASRGGSSTIQRLFPGRTPREC